MESKAAPAVTAPVEPRRRCIAAGLGELGMKVSRARPRLGMISYTSITALLACMASPAMAQDTRDNTKQGVAAAEPAGIEEIVVTAQFRSQNLQDTPLAISATSAAMIEAKGLSGIAEVAATAPSVTFNAGGTAGGAQATQVIIRGVGQTDFNIAVEPGVGIYVDDVYQGVMYASTPELLDLDRVEILRGPQGTLAGRNSVGGAIRLVTKAPSGDESGYIDASYGRFNTMSLRAGLNLALAKDRVFLRLNGLAKQSDGYVNRLDYQCATGKAPSAINSAGSVTSGSGCKIGTLGGQSVLALRGAIKAVLSDRVENTITVDYTNDKSEPSAMVLVYQGQWRGPGYNLTVTPPISNPVQNFVTGGTYTNYANFTGMIATPNQYTSTPVSNAKLWGVTNHLNVELADDLNLTSITAFRRIDTNANVDFDASPINRSMQTWALQHKQLTQELRLNGKFGDTMEWTLGGFHYRGDSIQSGRVNLDGAGAALPFYVPFDFTFADPVKVRSTAGFAHGVVHLTEKLNLTAGLRYTKETKQYQFVREMAPGVSASILSASVLPLDGLAGQFKGSRWDWRIAADYQPTSEVTIYGQVSTGFKGGGVNPRPFYAEQVRTFAPEKVTAYELGVKTQLFDRRVRLNLAAYNTDYSDMQLTLISCPQFVPAGARQNCSMTANVGDARIRGLELEAEARLFDGLMVDAALAYTDFEYRRIDPTTSMTLGMKAPYIPEWKIGAGVQYHLPLASGAAITPRLDYRYQSRVETQAINNSLNFIRGYGIFNGRIGYQSPDERIEFALTVKNLFDKYYYINLYDQAFQSYAFLSGQPGRPREWSLSARYTF